MVKVIKDGLTPADEQKLEEERQLVRDAYKEATGKDIAAWYKNNVEWMEWKIEEAKEDAKKEPEEPNDPKEETKAPINEDENEAEEFKYYKVVKGTINGVNYRDALPYIQLTPSNAANFGKVYLDLNGLDKLPKVKVKKAD